MLEIDAQTCEKLDMPELIDPAAPAPPAMDLVAMQRNARQAARFLKALAHDRRLLILCHLAHGECSVGELEIRLGMRQAHLSQQLARLREDGMVRTRRASRTIFYRLGNADAEAVLGLLYERFCRIPGAASACAPAPDGRGE